jgi:hypothetical protein
MLRLLSRGKPRGIKPDFRIKAHITRAAKEGRASPKAKKLESLRELIASLENYEPGAKSG